MEDVLRVVEYCRQHTVKNGGLFEVYPGPDGNLFMVIVNSCSESESIESFRPLGAFYCNYAAPGALSIEDEDPYFDGVESRKRHVKAIKQVIDILLKEGYPGTRIRFNDLPALKNTQTGNRKLGCG
ncbi:hypothetical protein UR09_06775 [Candidatus Nitromaritima sp. SCGC AAA799-A02]|nr:hypothetical protein UR09_06775 [Candidatus Nitromaritima sp. SCGC AAA799-A02]